MTSPPRGVRIERLTLASVRTYDRLELELDGGTTVFVGPNGVGKTNLLEACAVVLQGSSPRTSSELRLIRDDEPAARIAARVRVGDAIHERSVRFERGRGKRLELDGTVVRSLDDYAFETPVVAFLPERLLVIRGAPQRRRALVDQVTARVVPEARQVQASYATALQQRNALLRRAKTGRDVDAQLQPWTTQLLELGTAYRHHRARFLELLEAPYAERFAAVTSLTGGSFVAELRGSGDLEQDAAEVADAERRRGTTLLGPHLDDILPRVGDRDLRAFGSAGEQRAALLAFTFAARDLLAARTGLEPVVLLDEPWSELDSDRRRRLSAMLAPLPQVVVTSTEPPAHLGSVLPAARVLAVSSGHVTPWTDPTNT